MKKILILAMVLALMVTATAVLATPSGNSPWGLLTPEGCDHPSTPGMGDGDVYSNTKTGNTHCFKAH